jgi:hypothetical protein
VYGITPIRNKSEADPKKTDSCEAQGQKPGGGCEMDNNAKRCENSA